MQGALGDGEKLRSRRRNRAAAFVRGLSYMRHHLTAVALVLLAGTAGAQEPSSIDTPVHAFKLPRQLPECGLEAVLLRVAKNAGVPIGFERVTTCHGHQAIGFPEMPQPLDLAGAEVLDGVPVKEVLARIAAMDPDYDWAIVNGVAVFRPSSAWKDTKDPLTIRVPAMRFSEAPAVSIVAAILNWPQRAPDRRQHKTSVDFAGGTVLDALNSLVQSQPAMWYVSSNGERLFVDVWFAASNDGFGVAAPIPGLLSRQPPSSSLR